MIEINLLPVREARRRADLRQQLLTLVLGLIVTLGVIVLFEVHVSGELKAEQGRVRQMENDIDQFKPQLAQVEEFRKKKAQVQSKLDVIAELDRARAGPVRMMDELATYTPARLRIRKIHTEGSAITLEGESLDNELVAVFLGALNESEYFTNVDLDSTELGDQRRGGLKLVNFTIRAALAAPRAETK